MKETTMSRNVVLWSLLVGIVLCTSCDKDNPTSSPDATLEDNHDYENVGDDDDGSLLSGGAIVIPPDPISENSPRAAVIHRGDYIWQTITRTKYVHFNHRVIDSVNGIYKYDCSGFAHAIILGGIPTDHAKDLSDWKTRLHPGDSAVRAWTFYDYFRDHILQNSTMAQNEHWKVFESVDSLKKGDFILVRYDDTWRHEWHDDSGHSASTGHVMIAWDVRRVTTSDEVELQVYDCSSSGHTKSKDTRYCNTMPVAEINEDSGVQSGIGFGWMKYKISENGHRRPYAYRWSTNSRYWYNLREGDQIDGPGIKYDRIKGIIFARPI